MSVNVYRVDKPSEYRKAGPTDLLALLPAPGATPLFLTKFDVEKLVYGIVAHDATHISGPTGTAKSSLIEAMYGEPANFKAVCKALKFPYKPLAMWAIEMACYESPAEILGRRALRDGTTFDEDSHLVTAIREANQVLHESYTLIWLREIGRVHSSSVQGGLLNVIVKGDVVLSNGERVNARGIAFVSDSNYQAETSATHTLVEFDDALRRRLTVNICLDYMRAEQEVEILTHLLTDSSVSVDSELPVSLDEELLVQVVKLGQLTREHRSEGRLLSVPPPTIAGYLTFLRMASALPHLDSDQIALATVLGNASTEDRALVSGLIRQVFGLQQDDDDDDPVHAGQML